MSETKETESSGELKASISSGELKASIDPTLLPGKTNESENQLTPVQPAAEIISYVEIECRVVLYKGLFALVHCYDTNKSKIKVYQVQLTPEEYNNWIDDSVMESLILSKCGLTKS